MQQCPKGECFLPVDRVTTGRSRPGKVSYALACFIFRFLRCPLIENVESGRKNWASSSRFNGKRGGYRLIS
nr:hypothetical protein pHum4c_000116 [Escherichia coli]